MGFSRQEHWSGLPCPSPGNLSDAGIKPSPPAMAGGFFITEPPGKQRPVHGLNYYHYCRICINLGLSWWLSGKESSCQCRRYAFYPWVGKIPWRGKRQPTPVFLPGKSGNMMTVILTFRIALQKSVQSLSHVRLFVTPRIAACQASLSITNSQSSLKLMSIESVMPSSHLISVVPFSSCPQSLPGSESFPVSQLFA